MVIVDDHLALLAVAGRLPDLEVGGPVVTTGTFHFRMARAVVDAARSGSLSRRAPDPAAAARRVLHPPAHRLIVLDPRSSIDHTARMAVAHRANLLLAELLGSAIGHGAAVRVTSANVGRRWAAAMHEEGIDFATATL